MQDDVQKTPKQKEEKKTEAITPENDKESKKNEKIVGIEQEVDKWKSNYFRALADYQNIERRTREELFTFQKKANKNLLLKFLDVLDDLEKGAVFIKDEGLKLVKDKFVKILASEGVKELDVLNKSLDPHTAECIAVVEGKRDTIVIEVLRKGYTLHGEIIRVAQVTVEKKAG